MQQCFFIVEKQQKRILTFSLDSLIVTEQYHNGTSKNIKLLNEVNDSKFVTRKWNIVNDNSEANYYAGNEIIYDTKVLKSNRCDYNDPYILVKGDITVTVAPQTQVSFKNCAPFTKCITKIDGTTIDDAEDLDLVMLMQSLIEYSSNYSETTGSLWFYSKDEANNFNAENKAKILGNTTADEANRILRNATIAIPLKYLSNLEIT